MRCFDRILIFIFMNTEPYKMYRLNSLQTKYAPPFQFFLQVNRILLKGELLFNSGALKTPAPAPGSPSASLLKVFIVVKFFLSLLTLTSNSPKAASPLASLLVYEKMNDE